MILRKIRAFRRGTARYSVSGVDGLDDDDRVVVSVWPRTGGVSMLVSIGGDRLTASIDVTTTRSADRVPLDTIRAHAESLLATLTGSDSGTRQGTIAYAGVDK